MKKQLNKKQKQADHDLNVILILTLVPLLLFLTLKPTLLSYTNQTSVPLWLRLILLASCQFAIAGLGTSTVMLYRKESFRHFGLITKNLVTTLFQSLLVALPLIIFKGLTHQIHSYLPLQSIQLTKEVMSQSFPSNILAYLFICLIWGFWEGFNYVVIAEKIRIRFPSPYSWLDSGASYERNIGLNAPVNTTLEKGVYFDAGTGRGIGVEVRITNENTRKVFKML